MRKQVMVIVFLIMIGLVISCVQGLVRRNEQPSHPESKVKHNHLLDQEQRVNNVANEGKVQQLTEQLSVRYGNQDPVQWGERVDGVITQINTTEKVIALTFDACGGGGNSDGYDEELINFLITHNIPATLFINARWIDVNKDVFLNLSSNPLFRIENHGYKHKPLSITGRSVYGIEGTQNVKEIVEEIILNQDKIQNLTGKQPKYFRSGTAYYDDVAVQIAHELGVKVVNFNVLGDGGVTFNKDQVEQALLTASPGSIVLLHMNHPQSDVAVGVMVAVPRLIQQGYQFVLLQDYDERLI